MKSLHQPVLLQKSLEALNIKPEGVYVDATFGRGGHSRAILNLLGSKGRLIAVDRDLTAQDESKTIDDKRFTFCRNSFDNISIELEKLGLVGKVDGILMDIGVSSPQLDVAERGFSFSKPGPLDMRMDTENGETAAEWLARVDRDTLVKVLREYGDERFPGRIANRIIENRTRTKIETTDQLAEIIASAIPRWPKHHHPATRSFQAIRIAVNDELGQLERVLADTPNILAKEGRLVVISFHSLEDRIVKNFIRDNARTIFKKITKKPLIANEDELEQNPRARSAKLRVAEKL